MRMLVALAVLVTHLSHAGATKVLFHPLDYYLHGADAFLEDGKGNFYRNFNKEPVCMRGAKPNQLPPNYTVWNKARTFVFDRTKTYAIPLEHPIETQEQFAAVIQLLGLTEIGLQSIQDLMRLEDINGTSKKAYEVIGGERGVRFVVREEIVSVVNLLSAPSRTNLRDSTPVQIDRGVIYFMPGLEAGALAAALIFASQTDHAAGFPSLHVKHEGEPSKKQKGGHDYQAARETLLLSSQKEVVQAKEEQLFGVVTTIFDGLRAIALNEKQYEQDRLISILYQGHRAMHEFMVQLGSRFENQEPVQNYFRERQKTGKLRGIVAPLNKREVAEGYGLQSTLRLSQLEQRSEQRRCEAWLRGVRREAVGLLDPQIRATVERFDEQSDINR